MTGSNRTFLYQAVADDLRRRIEAGEYAKGTAIPSLAELVQSFGVSLITIRRALQQLMFEGVLYGRQGLGVFVADTRPIARVLTANAGSSLGDEIRRAGFEAGITEVSYQRIVPDADLRKRLNLNGKAAVYRHIKLVSADAVPVAIDEVHLPKAIADKIGMQLGREFVFPLLHRAGVQVQSTHFKFTSLLASPEQAALLGVTPRFPLIVAHYLLIGRDGAPMLEGSTSSRADRMTFELTALHKRG